MTDMTLTVPRDPQTEQLSVPPVLDETDLLLRQSKRRLQVANRASIKRPDDRPGTVLAPST